MAMITTVVRHERDENHIFWTSYAEPNGWLSKKMHTRDKKNMVVYLEKCD